MCATTNLRLLMFVGMDTGVVIEANFGNDQTICNNVRFDSLLFVLSKLSIHTFCTQIEWPGGLEGQRRWVSGTLCRHTVSSVIPECGFANEIVDSLSFLIFDGYSFLNVFQLESRFLN